MICSFLGDKVIAMLLGTLGAYLVSLPYLGKNGIEKSAGEALKSAGVVLLITGAGGSFASVITATGIGDAIVGLLGTNTTSILPAMFLAYGIGMVFRVAQGSGTVAGMTSMGIMATIAPAIGCPSRYGLHLHVSPEVIQLDMSMIPVFGLQQICLD